ncbi:MAG: OmpA family protein [Sphingobacteriia bacterium]|jgi:outer membrane protein OmpA-like peptidoglycan-associated protein|nr:OmpA family protein [Sphingobacteriia bacterium]
MNARIAAYSVLVMVLAGCSSAPKDNGPTRYVFDTGAPVPAGELREQAGQIVHIFRPHSDIVQIMPYETFALGSHLPFIVEQVRVSWKSTDGRTHDVLFRFDSADVLAAQRDRLAQFIKRNSGSIESVVIQGRTDSTGSAAYNMALSERRADAVQSQLIAMGVAADRITTTAFGAGEPIASNATAAGRQRNRSGRVILNP